MTAHGAPSGSRNYPGMPGPDRIRRARFHMREIAKYLNGLNMDEVSQMTMQQCGLLMWHLEKSARILDNVIEMLPRPPRDDVEIPF